MGSLIERVNSCHRRARWSGDSRGTAAASGAQVLQAQEPALPRSAPNSPHLAPKAGAAGSNPAEGTSQETPDRSWSGAFDISLGRDSSVAARTSEAADYYRGVRNDQCSRVPSSGTLTR